jgi:uncharacterized membrane protein YeaQ/YmgE (transglycosylase-associated protein family)
MGTIRTIVIGL